MFIFISYSSKDRALVDELAADLELWFDHEGVVVWYDRELNRSGGHPWWELILESIRRCDVFINALSPHVLSSEPCRREHDYALALSKPTLPVQIADVDIRDLPVKVQVTQLVNYQQRSREQQWALKGSIRNLPPAPPLPSPLPTPPEVPLDPVAVARDQIARLTTDADQQRLLIMRIEDLTYEALWARFVPDLVARLLTRDDVLTVRNMERVKGLRDRSNPAPPPEPPPAQVVTPKPPAVVQPARVTLESLLPAPFAVVPISAGKVTLIERYDEKAYFGTKGQTKVFDVPAFQMARYLVTNAQYRVFVEAKGYDTQKWWTADGWAEREKNGWSGPRFWEDASMEVFNRPDHPVVGVSWFEAVAFCRWLSAAVSLKITLPTEQMWQRAAQGDKGWAYPWGNEWDGARCQNSVSPVKSKATAPVTQYAGRGEGKGDSPFGVSDMAGNVWEWCLTDYETGKQDENARAINCVLRGGSWVNFVTDVFRADFRFRLTPDISNNYGGFRFSLL